MSNLPNSGTPVAVFDFDGTLTDCDTLVPFLRSAAGRAKFLGGLPLMLLTMARYRVHNMDRTQAKETLLSYFLAGRPEDVVARTAEEFAATTIPGLINAAALDRLRWHAGLGHRVLVVSASLEAYLAPWASLQPVEAVLGTRLAVKDGCVTGRLDGPNCHGAEKARRLLDYLGESADSELYVYGDSSGDEHLLQMATYPAFGSFWGRYHRLRATGRLIKAVL